MFLYKFTKIVMRLAAIGPLHAKVRPLPSWRNGPWKSVDTRFCRWSLQGVWEHVFEELIAGVIVDEITLMSDSTTIEVHQYGSGVK